jgi:hypothetical protein
MPLKIQWFLVYLCSCHHYLILQHFHHSKKENLYLLTVTLHSPLPQAITNLHSVCMDLLILDISYK